MFTDANDNTVNRAEKILGITPNNLGQTAYEGCIIMI